MADSYSTYQVLSIDVHNSRVISILSENRALKKFQKNARGSQS